jgi:hypothetical protein
MSEKSDVEKLRILLPHWIEHNNSHVAEFVKWQQAVTGEVSDAAVERLAEAVEALEQGGRALDAAMAELGGSLEGESHHHHHHHEHD